MMVGATALPSEFRQPERRPRWNRGAIGRLASLLFGVFLLSAFPAHAATKYVATWGSDGAAGSSDAPWRTPNYALAHAACGDIVLMRAGTYDSLNTVAVPSTSCSSFENALTLKAYPNEAVHLPTIVVHSERFLIFENLILDGAPNGQAEETISIGGGHAIGQGAGYLRFVNVDIHGPNTSPFPEGYGGAAVVSLSQGSVGFNEFIGGRLHDAVGESYSIRKMHGFYVLSPSNLIDGVEIYNIDAYAIVNYNDNPASVPSNNVYRNNYIHHTGKADRTVFAIGITVGSNNKVYNNIITRSTNGIAQGPTGSGTLIANNTIYGLRGGGIQRYPAIEAAGSFSVTIQNNIVFGNGIQNSIDTSGATDPTASNNLTTDPSFVNASGSFSLALDFAISAASQARDTGTGIALVGHDYGGVQRPVNFVSDIGAFEYTGAAPSPPPGAGTASFVGIDLTTQGNWQGAYGADGFRVVSNYTSYPGYASVTTSGVAAWRWSDTTDDARALRKVTNASDRIAATLYSSTTFSIDVNMWDGASHRLALYFVDWDSLGRSQTIQVVDGNSLAVLDARTISGFTGGQYLVYDVTGHIKFQVTQVAGMNAVYSGIFFGGPVGTPPTSDYWTWTNSTVAPGAALPVSFGVPAGSRGFFALYAAGDDAWWSYKAFIYPPPGATGGTVVFTAPSVVGSYQVRFVTEHDGRAKAVSAFWVQ